MFQVFETIKKAMKLDFLVGKSDARTGVVKKNAFASVFIKGLSIATALLIVPLTIDYVNPTQYGIWLALSSFLSLFSFFDVGFGNGFRNKFATAITKGDDKLAKIYVSTVYAYLAAIFFTLWCVILVLNNFLPWHDIVSIDSTLKEEVSYVFIIIFTFFCFQVVFKTITIMLTADQKAAKSSLINVLGQVISLCVIFVMTKVSSGSLIKLALAISLSQFVVLAIANFWFFNGRYKKYRPSLKLAKWTHAKDILSLGGKFFVIQIAAILQYQIINLLIAHYFGPIEVTQYNIAFKYFGVLTMLFSILLLPLWSAVTEAKAKNDFAWIKSTVKKYLILAFLFVFGGLLMLYFSPYVYNFWIGDKVEIPFDISLWTAVFSITSLFSGIFISVLNGLGAVKIQFYVCFVTPLIFLVTSYLLIVNLSLGVVAIIVASILSNISGLVIAPLQYYQIVKGKGGIWVQ